MSMVFRYFLTFVVLIIILFSLVESYHNGNKHNSVLALNSITKADDFAILAQNLEVPWSLVFLPNHSILFTERAGRVKLLDKEQGLREKTIHMLKDVVAIEEGGLLGIEIDPDFQHNHFVYLYYTHRIGDQLLNKVVRFELRDHQFINEQVIVDGIPAGRFHNGGRIKFGPDKYLYIGTGDAEQPNLSQDRNSLAGKILRVKGSQIEIYSLGHRNVQGLAWDDKGNLWATEHGQIAYDELNLIRQGGNYGWPNVRADRTQEGILSPIIHSGTDTWAPSGLAFYKNSLLFTGLKGEALYEYKIAKHQLKEHYKGRFGRLRDVVVGPDGYLYLLTNNRDGRGTPIPSDDRLIVIKK